MGVSGIPLCISGKEDIAYKDKGAYNLSTKAITLGVAMVHYIGPTFEPLVWHLHEPFHHTCPTDGPKALHHHIQSALVRDNFLARNRPNVTDGLMCPPVSQSNKNGLLKFL